MGRQTSVPVLSMFRLVFDRNSSSESLEKSVFVSNPLFASVLRENVRVMKKRAIIGLWPHWQSLLGQVQEFGRVLSIGRNGYAVLGKIGEYPEMRNAACGHCACGTDGSMEFYFSAWNRANVIVEAQTSGWLYAVEFYDACGETIHKICLTAESDFEAFRDWVELHQNSGTETLREDFADRPRDEGSATFVPTGAIFLRPEALSGLLRRMIDEEQCAQFVVGSDGFVQGADLRPTVLRENGQWLFASDELTGLHLRQGRLVEVYLHQVGSADLASRFVLKAHDPEGRLVCAVTPPRFSEAANWNEFLTDATTSFQLNKTES